MLRYDHRFIQLNKWLILKPPYTELYIILETLFNIT